MVPNKQPVAEALREWAREVALRWRLGNPKLDVEQLFFSCDFNEILLSAYNPNCITTVMSFEQ